MIKKYSEALSLLWTHRGLFSAIVLTVWLPGNILTYAVASSGAMAGWLDFTKLELWIEILFGPIYIGALVFALYHIKLGKSVTYKEAIGAGLERWGLLFAARLAAQILIVLGLLALIVPGIILLLRYSLIDAAVIVEGLGVNESRSRSVELTTGRRWQILWAGVLFLFSSTLLTIVIYLPLFFFEWLIILPVEIALACITDVVFAVFHIVLFLFYWESVPSTRIEQ